MTASRELELSACINTNCPWSGEPVQADSLAWYNGRVVGFCNPDCRDKFEAAIRLFEGRATGTDYAARFFGRLPAWSVEDLQLKVYSITKDDRLVSRDIITAARSYVKDDLPPAVGAEGESEGVGYIILHEGEIGVWLLAHWWAHRDICCQRMALFRPNDDVGFTSVDDRPLLGCVWEQVVTAYERNAWVRHGLNRPARPSAYLADYLPDGRY